MKRCCKCGEEKPLSEFYERNGKLISPCKACYRSVNNARYQKRRDENIGRRSVPDFDITKFQKCSHCDNVKPFDDFHVNRARKTGRCVCCKVCTKVQSKKYYYSRGKILYSENKQKFRDRQKAWREKNPSKRREYEIRHKYRIELSEYNKLFIKQNGQCAICGSNGDRGILCIDHEHKTGRVRGLLCQKCNAGIGYLQDNVAVLHNAANYLQEYAVA